MGWLCIFIVVECQKSMHVWRPIDLYTITTTKLYLLYANLGDIAPWLFWSLDLLWSNKAGTWVTSHSRVCSLIAENTKVPPPGYHRRCSLVWQSALTGYPLGAMQSARQPRVGKYRRWRRYTLLFYGDSWHSWMSGRDKYPTAEELLTVLAFGRPFSLMPIFYR